MAAAGMGEAVRHDGPASFDCRVYTRLWRGGAASLFALGRADLLLCIYILVTVDTPPITPLVLARVMAIAVVAPLLATHLIRRAFMSRVTIDAEAFTAERRGFRLEIPRASVESMHVSAIPLPLPAFILRTASGRRLGYVFEPDDLPSMIAAVGETGVLGANAALHHPFVTYAQARAADVAGFWRRWPAKFVLFAFPWAAIFFNLDQHITYGGTLGQYYLEGLGPWLLNLAIYWGGVAMYLTLFAAVLRGIAEGVALGTAIVAPSLAMRVRRAVEIASAVLFYAGVPVLVLLRFVA